MARRPPTEAQKAERAEQLEHLHAQVADKVADPTSSEQWQAWLNRPGMSGDSELWEGWSHARQHEQALPG